MARGTDKDDAFYFPEEQLYAIAGISGKNLIVTGGKPYPIFDEDWRLPVSFHIMDDAGQRRLCLRDECAHLDGEAWTILKESDLTPEQRRMADLPTEDATIAELRERIEALEARVPVEAKADENDWIPHDGGECPVKEGALIDIRCRDGLHVYSIPALEPSDPWKKRSAMRWLWCHYDSDITHYRPAKQAPEWPQVGDSYWYINMSGEVVFASHLSAFANLSQFFLGIYKTQQDAEEAAGKIKRIMDHLRSGEHVILATDTRMVTAEKVELQD